MKVRSVGGARMLSASIGVLLAAGLEAPAFAEPCEGTPSALLETFPASGARGTPQNGLVVLVYCPPDDPFVDRSQARLLEDLGAAAPSCACPTGAECATLSGLERCLRPVPTEVEVSGDRVVLATTGGDLEPGTRYVIEAPGPSGTLRPSFETGEGTDQAPPVFDGPRSLRFIGCGEGFPPSSACPSDRAGFVVVLGARAADDEAGRVNLEYVGLQVTASRHLERGRSRGDGTDEVTVTAFVPIDQVDARSDRLCFRMAARDPYGHETVAAAELCDHTPDFSPFGSLCSVPPGTAGGASAGALLLLLALVFGRLRASRLRREPPR